MDTPLYKILLGAGAVLLLLGLLAWALQGRLDWLGRLPGDFRVEKEGFRFYAPIATMLLLSLLLNVVVYLFRYFFQK